MNRKIWLYNQTLEMTCPSCGVQSTMTPDENGWSCNHGCRFSPEGEFESGPSTGNKTQDYLNQLKRDVLKAFREMEVKSQHLAGIKVERSGKFVVVRTPNPGILIGPGGCTVKGAGEHIGCRIKVLQN